MKIPDKDFYAEFNEMIIDIGSRMFDLQILQGKYITDLLGSLSADHMELDMNIPLFNGDSYSTVHLESIYYDHEDDMVKVAVAGKKEMILLWSDIDVASQNEILQTVHFNCMSEKSFNDLNDGEKRYYV